MILISACLAGRNVKYNGRNNAVPWLCRWVERHQEQVLLVCPEVMGGLSVPRLPAEIQLRESHDGTPHKNRRVVNSAGEDVTEQFLRGAEKVLELVKQHHITTAIMKANSPSCSGFYIYDGTFSGTRIAGQGITAALLTEHGVKVYSEETLTPDLLTVLNRERKKQTMNMSSDINEERLKNTFIELVGVPCPSCDEKQEAELLVKKLQGLGMEPQVDRAGEQCGGTTGNIWGLLKGNVPGALRLFFEAHMDSVAPTTGTTVIEKDGVLYSDGTTTLGGDDKSGVAAVLEAMQRIIENNLPHGDIQVCFTIGEETGSYGVRYMDKTMIQADAGYCMDCGGHPGAIFNASPKAINLNLTVKGKSAHAGLEPEKGINAIMLAAEALNALPAYGRIDAETTLSVDMIDGGLAPNIVPEACEIVIDIRCPDVTKLERLKNETVEIFRNAVEAKGGTVEIAVKEVAPGVNLDTDHATVKLAVNAAEKLGFTVSTGFTGGCSDANFLCGMGLPTVLLATGMDKIHTTEERLALEDLNNAARWVLAIVQEAAAQAQGKF